VAADKVGNWRPPERVCTPFPYVLRTAKDPVRCHQNRVFREGATTAAASFLLYASSSL